MTTKKQTSHSDIDLKSIRNTFRLSSPLTGQRYDDIISAHLQARFLTFSDFCNKTISEKNDRNKTYTLLINDTLYKALHKNKEEEIKTIISFQNRTNGNFAVARLFNEAITHKNDEEAQNG